MAIFTSTEIEEQLAEWKTALKRCAAGQSYEVEGRKLTRADLPEIRATLRFLDAERAKISGHTASVTVVGRPAR